MKGATAIKNNNAGVEIQNVPGITIGGTANGARNVIAGNGGENVSIGGLAANGNTVAGNYIGTNASGTAALGGSGVGLHNQANNNTVGRHNCFCAQCDFRQSNRTRRCAGWE